jgi:hypothetical protein
VAFKLAATSGNHLLALYGSLVVVECIRLSNAPCSCFAFSVALEQ